MNNIQTFRPKSGYIFAGIVGAIFIGLFAVVLVEGNWQATLASAGLCSFACVSAWLIYIRPKLELFDEGMRVVNPLRTFTLGWESVDAIDTKYALEIFTDGKKITVFAAPAPSRYHARKMRVEDVKGLGFKAGESIRAGDSPRSHSGVAAHLARTKLKEFKAAKRKTSIPLTVRFNYTGAALLLASVVLLLL
jgi:hypothetical protein